MVCFTDKENTLLSHNFPCCPCTGTAKSTAQIPFFSCFTVIVHFLFFRVPGGTCGNQVRPRASCIHKSPPMFPGQLSEGMVPQQRHLACCNLQQTPVSQNRVEQSLALRLLLLGGTAP